MDYLSNNNAFYSAVMLNDPLYGKPYPNAEEAARGAAVLKYLAHLRQRHIAPDVAPRLLDLGCGRGWLTTLLSTFGHCEGIEPSQGAVEFARRNFPGVSFRVGVMADLLQSPDFTPYDIIVSGEVIEHVPWPHKTQFVKEIRLGLGERGHCIITTPRRELLWIFQRNHAAIQVVEDWLTEKELLRLFSNCGFKLMGHDRAFPMRPRALDQSSIGRMLDRTFGRGPFGPLVRGVDFALSMYQVWWFRRAD
jgi:SAM-dependent methyltransferase